MKYVYYFDEGKKEMKEVLGGKGANLAEMTKMGVPVPPGFTITTEVCDYYYKNGNKYPDEMDSQIKENLEKLEKQMGKKLGDKEDPLLVSVRSGAAISMPGMMDTVLNLGLNDESIKGFIAKTNNPRFCWDSYRRFIQMFGNVVMGISSSIFESALDSVKEEKGVEFDTDLTYEDLQKVVDLYKNIVKEKAGKPFPQEPMEQLRMSVDAVFGSWNNDRAITYRRINSIRGLLGTAVNIQAMVYGNMGETSGTGVCFSRDPSTGAKEFYGEFLMNAQGEDVVSGVRTPLPIIKLKEVMPSCYDELVAIKDNLEKHYTDMQDMEFTIQEGKLFLLQTRIGKRTAHSAVKVAVDMVSEGLIDEKTAVLRVDPAQLEQLLHNQLDPVAKKEAKVLAKGLPASPGAAVGKVVFTADKARDMATEGEKVVLVRSETSPEDIEGMNAAVGILTARGGMTSHAAVVARGMGKCCVAGCSSISVSEGFFLTKEGVQVKELDYISVDGTTGEVFLGELRVIDPEFSEDFSKLMSWADKFRVLGVRANADTPGDARKSLEFGAEGIGLCRTEHMFFEESRIKAVREMILAPDEDHRRKALAKILPMQQKDFKELFEVMGDKTVTIRLLDPPLHEFLPKDENDIKDLAVELEASVETIQRKIDSLHEFNPMLGHRGCRLAITYPEIAEIQSEAIIAAAIEVKKSGVDVVPEIMIPLIGEAREFIYLKKIVDEVASKVIAREGVALQYKVGTMIEIPRAALLADKVAEHAEFFSFGTNDLTQMTFGYSRDDAGVFLPEYVEKGILDDDPFQVLDQEGVGILVDMTVSKGRMVNENLKCGICGEHGGEPKSVEFCHRVGLDYVSCSPFRIPIARLAAAHAKLKEK